MSPTELMSIGVGEDGNHWKSRGRECLHLNTLEVGATKLMKEMQRHYYKRLQSSDSLLDSLVAHSIIQVDWYELAMDVINEVEAWNES